MAGGIAAWLGFTLPSAILLVLFGTLAVTADVAAAGWVHGLKLAAVAVVAGRAGVDGTDPRRRMPAAPARSPPSRAASRWCG